MLMTILLAIGVFAFMMAALALGYIISGRCISTSSCHAPRVTRADGEVTCQVCGRTQSPPAQISGDTNARPGSVS
ncbi:MAG TPA: hypothetical protein PLM14_15450 [Candidatus Hydrogenedentes bacterium]|nr:hypothetical protein [Candidatus Hydrogenedentota bacterium]HQH54713.1 hypothetical protein [Candidatus Hydrogenedentota bacterium]